MFFSRSLKFYKLCSEAYLPIFATEGSACFDFRASLLPGAEVKTYSWLNEAEITTVDSSGKIALKPGHRYLIPTNLIMDIPEGFSVRIHPRSGLALKQAITLINCEGVIDSDYVEPTYITLFNLSDAIVDIKDGDRVAQGELVRTETYDLEEVYEPPAKKTTRSGGFGSTGV
jgi:dUTP pyrophosphatase